MKSTVSISVSDEEKKKNNGIISSQGCHHE